MKHHGLLVVAILSFVLSAGAHAQIFLTADLDSAGTGSGSSARGTLWGTLSADMSTLTYQVTYANLAGTYTASHFHHTSGLTPVTFAGTTAAGQWAGLSDVDIQELLQGRVYINIHSTVAPGGEIRGFLRPVDGIGFSVSMDGPQAGTASSGQGTAWVVMDSGSARIRWGATVGGLTDTITAAHFHNARGVLFATPFNGLVSEGTRSGIADSVARMFAKGEVYMNVHTRTYPAGEIRGTVELLSLAPTAVAFDVPAKPVEFRLEQNYPNPFNPSTVVRYQLNAASHVRLTVFNLIGQEVATLVDGPQPAGVHVVSFDAGRLASGMYFYRLTSDAGFSATRKMVLLR